jgi:cobalt-zinc-cadmium efflux system outer membrane protein
VTRPGSVRQRAAVAAAVAALGALGGGCAGEQESLGSIRSSAEARLERRGSTAPRDEAAEQLLKSPLTAESATRIALLNNRRVQAAYAELGVAHAAVEQALRLPNPELEAAFRFGSGDPDIELFAMLGLSELLFLPLRSDAAHAELAATRTEVVGFVVGLAFDVRSAFYAYQAALQNLELARTVLRATEASADAAGRLHDAGNVTDLDLATQRAFAEEARVATRRADTAAADARAHLSALLGVSDTSGWSAAGRLADPPREELALEALEYRSVAQSLELKATQEHDSAARERADAEGVARWVPGLKAGVSARREGEWRVGPAVGIEVPLFYQNQGVVDAARAEALKQRSLLNATTTELRNRAHAAASRLVAARENALRYRDVLLPLRKRVLDETELHYNAMSVGVFQLLTAKREQIETARTYVDLLREYWEARNEVERLWAGAARAAAR